jgi:hypothetical protein
LADDILSRSATDHCQCVKCRGYQPRQQNEQQAIDVAQCRPVRRFAPEHIDLVAKNQDLRFTLCADRNSPSAPQSNLSSWIIGHERHPIRAGSPGTEFPRRTEFKLDATTGAQVGELSSLGQLVPANKDHLKLVTVWPPDLANGRPIYPRP